MLSLLGRWILELLDYQDFPAVLAALVLLTLIGRWLAPHDTRALTWSRRGAVLASLGHAALLWWEWSPELAVDWLGILLRALLTGGLALAVLRIILAISLSAHRTAVEPLVRRWSTWQADRHISADHWRLRRKQEEERRRDEEAWRQAAPERELAQQRALEHSRQAQADTRRRAAVRLECEALFARHAADIAGRFPRADFERQTGPMANGLRSCFYS